MLREEKIYILLEGGQFVSFEESVEGFRVQSLNRHTAPFMTRIKTQAKKKFGKREKSPLIEVGPKAETTIRSEKGMIEVKDMKGHQKILIKINLFTNKNF